MEKKHMNTKEMQDWDSLYEYVRCKVMGYDNNQSLSRHMVLRLKGLSGGKYMANNKINNLSNYSYEVILNAFKLCMPNIKNVLSRNSFKDENHKFAYILKIVESQLNDVYIRMENARKANETTANIETYQDNVITGYKTREVDHDRFSELW